ncbi:adenylate kinase, partial [Buchnera aphidicola]|nr:adenylate kinase [Buchnera aphidicola]
ELTIREDDKIEIIKKRLIENESISKLLKKYYIEEDKKGNLKYFQIDGTKKLQDIQKKIEYILK